MKILCILCLFILISNFVSSQNPIPNPSLEHWSGTPLNPDNWYSNSTPTHIAISQTTSHTGNYAAKGNVIDVNGSPFLSPFLGCNFPVTERYIAMNFFFKANLDSGDVFQVSASIYDSSNNLLASGFFNILFQTNTFLPFTFLIDSVNTGIPDHALVSFTIIPITPHPSSHLNSFFVVDDVEFVSVATGTFENNTSSDLNVFPIPAKNKIYINSENKVSQRMDIILYNTYGEIVFEKMSDLSMNKKISEEINLENISAGIYFLSMKERNNIRYKKIIIQK